jgi:hypothetical protein
MLLTELIGTEEQGGYSWTAGKYEKRSILLKIKDSNHEKGIVDRIPAGTGRALILLPGKNLGGNT